MDGTIMNRKARRAAGKKSTTRTVWRSAGDLKPGDKIVTKDGRVGTVKAVTPTQGLSTVHNFAVEHDHTYFVGDGPGVWVHNRYNAIENAIASPLSQHNDITGKTVEEVAFDIQSELGIIDPSADQQQAIFDLAQAKLNPGQFGDDVNAVQSSLDFTVDRIGVIGGWEAGMATREAYTDIYAAIAAIDDKSTKLIDIQALSRDVQLASNSDYLPNLDPYHKLASALSGGINVLVGVGKTVSYIGDQIEKRPILKWALVGLDVATGPVGFAIRTGLGKVFGNQINAAIGAATNGIAGALESRGLDPKTIGLATLGAVSVASLALTGSKFLRNGGIGRVKHIIKFTQLRFKFNGLAKKHLLPKYQKLDPDLEFGMTGSFKTRKVGNPQKERYGENVDLDNFDVDYWIKSDKLHNKYGSNLRADPAFREILSKTPGFEGLRPHKKGFSIKFLPNE